MAKAKIQFEKVKNKADKLELERLHKYIAVDHIPGAIFEDEHHYHQEFRMYQVHAYDTTGMNVRQTFSFKEEENAERAVQFIRDFYGDPLDAKDDD